MPQPRPDRRPRRVDPGEDQQQQVAVLQLPVDRLAVDLGLDDQRRQIVPRFGLAVLHQLQEVGAHVGGDLLADPVVPRRQLEVAVDPVAEDVGIGVGHTDHLGDPVDGDVLAVLGGRVGCVTTVELRDQPAGVLAELVLHRLDLLRARTTAAATADAPGGRAGSR